MSTSSPRDRRGLGFMVRALRHRNFALFFSGQIVSLVGTWLSMVATSWLVYRLTRESQPEHAALMLGVVNFAAQIPIFLLAPLAGVWLDRWNRHHVLVATQSLSMLQSFAMAYLVLSGRITLTQIITLSVLQGIVNALDIPTRQSFIVQMIDRPEDLSNAIALNSSIVQAARLVGPAVAGFLIYAFGEGLCFLIDGFSFLAVLGALLAMRIAPRPAGQKHLPVAAALWEGLVYAFGFAPIRALLLMVAIISLMAMSQSVLMPIYANQVMGGEERMLGILLGAAGLGALLGGIYLTTRTSVLGLGTVIVVGAVGLGVAMLMLATSRYLAVSLVALLIAGAALLMQAASSNTLLQTIVDEDKRGRRDEPVCDGLHGHGPVWQSAGRQRSHRDRHPLDLGVGRAGVPRLGRSVCVAFEGDSPAGAADLHRQGNLAGHGCGSASAARHPGCRAGGAQRGRSGR